MQDRTPEEEQANDRRTKEITDQLVALLNEIHAMDRHVFLDATEIRTPVGRIRFRAGEGYVLLPSR